MRNVSAQTQKVTVSVQVWQDIAMGRTLNRRYSSSMSDLLPLSRKRLFPLFWLLCLFCILFSLKLLSTSSPHKYPELRKFSFQSSGSDIHIDLQQIRTEGDTPSLRSSFSSLFQDLGFSPQVFNDDRINSLRANFDLESKEEDQVTVNIVYVSAPDDFEGRTNIRRSIEKERENLVAERESRIKFSCSFALLCNLEVKVENRKDYSGDFVGERLDSDNSALIDSCFSRDIMEDLLKEESKHGDVIILPRQLRKFQSWVPLLLQNLQDSFDGNIPLLILPLNSYVNVDRLLTMIEGGYFMENSIILSSQLGEEANDVWARQRTNRIFPMLLTKGVFKSLSSNDFEFIQKQSNWGTSSDIELLSNESLWLEMGIKLSRDDSFCNGFVLPANRKEACDPLISNRMILRDNADYRTSTALSFIANAYWKHSSSLRGLEARADVEKQVTVIIKHKSEFRSSHLQHLVKSIRIRYPSMQIIVGDDSRRKQKTAFVAHDKRTRFVPLPPDCGLSYGRNFLVQQVRTPFTLLLDDDNLFGEETQIEMLLKDMADSGADLVGGTYMDLTHNFEVEERNSYAMNFSPGSESGSLNLWYAPKIHEGNLECRDVDTTHNFFLAKTDALKQSGWRNRLLMSEHEAFFLDFKASDFRVRECPMVSVLHDKQVYPSVHAYRAGSQRYSSYCPAFRNLCQTNSSLTTLLTPWHEVDCEKKFACHIYGAMDFETQSQRDATDWFHDPLRRMLCLEFDDEVCDFHAKPVDAEKKAAHSWLKSDRHGGLTPEQSRTRPDNFMDVFW